MKDSQFFFVLLLEQDITRKKRVDKNMTEIKVVNNSKEYKIKAIQFSAVYTNKAKGH